jgi:hypothetical protein
VKLQYWIIAAGGAVTFSTMIASASAASISTVMAGLKTTKEHLSAFANVVQRHKSSQVRRLQNRYTNDVSGWYPHDSNQLPFGSALWWQQKDAERGGARGH